MKTYQFHPDLKTGGRTNEERAHEGSLVVRTFQDLTGLTDEDGLPTAVGDMLGHIMHLAGAHGYDPEEFLGIACERAHGYFREESNTAHHEGDEPLEDPPRLIYPQEGAEDEN